MKMRDKVKSYKTTEATGKKIHDRQIVLKRAGVANATDTLICMGLDCLIIKNGLKVSA